jgi:hypothetical protein
MGFLATKKSFKKIAMTTSVLSNHHRPFFTFSVDWYSTVQVRFVCILSSKDDGDDGDDDGRWTG